MTTKEPAMDAPAARLLAHLPYLRRYARALTGDGGVGDGLVGHAIAHLLKEPDPSVTPEQADRETDREAGRADRGALYALLNRLFDASGGHPVATGRHPMEAALARLPEVERRIYLLTALEGLPADRAGAVLGLEETAARDHLARAQEAMRDGLVATVMIVEDDAVIAFDLAETVRGMGHTVCGTAATMGAALATAESFRPTLALMDLRLAHGDSGISTAQALRHRSDLPIIFVTAFADELHRRGLEHLGPVIRKPFTREEIESAITRAVFAPRQPARIPALAGLEDAAGDPPPPPAGAG
jgi:CheY-like chemotaxis protein